MFSSIWKKDRINRRQGVEGLARRHQPYAEWIERIRVKLDEVETRRPRR